jgi:hypothetical protein
VTVSEDQAIVTVNEDISNVGLFEEERPQNAQFPQQQQQFPQQQQLQQQTPQQQQGIWSQQVRQR